MIDEYLNGDRRRRRARGTGRTTEGIGEIASVDTDRVTVRFPDRDQAATEYGPVPFLWGGPTGDGPVEGDLAYLHVNPDGQPAYAVAWPT